MKRLVILALILGNVGCATMNADGTPTKTGVFWGMVGKLGEGMSKGSARKTTDCTEYGNSMTCTER